MPYHGVANLVTVTKTNMIRRNSLWVCSNHSSENTAPSLPQKLRSGVSCCRSILQSCAAVSATPEVTRKSAQKAQELQNLTIPCYSPFTEAVPPRRDRSIRGVPPSVNGLVHSRNVYTKVLITLNQKKKLLCTPSS